ncbi:MAG: hypothetical protein LKG31_02310 [Lactobacillus sp.]|nr:hypothetical protein [Lactobacillus sp.]
MTAHGVTLPEGYNAMFSKAKDGTPTKKAPFGTDHEQTWSIEIDDNHGKKVGDFETHFELQSADAKLISDITPKMAKSVEVDYDVNNEVQISEVLKAHGVTLPEGYNAMFNKNSDKTPVTENQFGPVGIPQKATIEIDNNKGEEIGKVPTTFVLQYIQGGYYRF